MKIPHNIRLEIEAILKADLIAVELEYGRYAKVVTGVAKATAVTIGNHIYFADDAPAIDSKLGFALLVHECCHVIDYQKQGKVGFLSRYFYQYFKGRLSGLSDYQAYREIETEKKAFAAEAELASKIKKRIK